MSHFEDRLLINVPSCEEALSTAYEAFNRNHNHLAAFQSAEMIISFIMNPQNKSDLSFSDKT
jgi:hypothetical protein